MEMIVDDGYECPACSARVAIDPGADVLVLLHGGGGRVEQVVTADDIEVHRCPFSSGSPSVDIRLV